MKSTYNIRRVDRLGRIVLPVEFRRTMGIGVSDELELFIDGNAVVLKKLNCTCVFCGSTDKIMRKYQGKHICLPCIVKLSELAKPPETATCPGTATPSETATPPAIQSEVK